MVGAYNCRWALPYRMYMWFMISFPTTKWWRVEASCSTTACTTGRLLTNRNMGPHWRSRSLSSRRERSMKSRLLFKCRCLRRISAWSGPPSATGSNRGSRRSGGSGCACRMENRPKRNSWPHSLMPRFLKYCLIPGSSDRSCRLSSQGLRGARPRVIPARIRFLKSSMWMHNP